MADNIISKIEKLLNKAENTTNEHEASAFMEKAQALMLEHAIHEGMLNRDTGEPAKPVIVQIDFGKNGSGIKAKRSLMNGIAQANRCRLWMSHGRRILSLAGFEDDVKFVQMLYASVEAQMLAAEGRAAKEFAGNRSSFRTNYFYGYTGRVTERLLAAAREAEHEAVESSGGSVALVLADRASEVSKITPQLRSSYGARNQYDGAANAAGRRDGSNADLSGGKNNLAARKELG